MRTTLVGAAAIVAAGAAVALAATGIADEGDAARGATNDRVVERIAVAPASREARRGSTPRGQKLTYFEVPTPLEVPPKTEEAVELSKCPRGSKAVTGYFHPERAGTFLDQSRPVLSTARMWTIGAYNSTDTTEHVTFGLVCLSRVK